MVLHATQVSMSSPKPNKVNLEQASPKISVERTDLVGCSWQQQEQPTKSISFLTWFTGKPDRVQMQSATNVDCTAYRIQKKKIIAGPTGNCWVTTCSLPDYGQDPHTQVPQVASQAAVNRMNINHSLQHKAVSFQEAHKVRKCLVNR